MESPPWLYLNAIEEDTSTGLGYFYPVPHYLLAMFVVSVGFTLIPRSCHQNSSRIRDMSCIRSRYFWRRTKTTEAMPMKNSSETLPFFGISLFSSDVMSTSTYGHKYLELRKEAQWLMAGHYSFTLLLAPHQSYLEEMGSVLFFQAKLIAFMRDNDTPRMEYSRVFRRT